MNTVELPIPPSVNAIWRVTRVKSGARVTLSKAYRTWLDHAILALRMGLSRVMVYPVAVHVEIVRGVGWRKGRDVDNVLKVILDSLVKAGRLTDDDEDHVTAVSVCFGPRAEAACVRVTVQPVDTTP